MTTLFDIPESDLAHHVAAQVAEWENIPLDDTPTAEDMEALYKQGYATGLVGGQKDKRYGWSLDYAAGYSNGLCDLFLDSPEMQFLVNLNHTEFDEF